MQQPLKRLSFVDASGGKMGHYGEKKVTFRAGKDGEVVSMAFQASDVQKPIVSVRRMVEKGHTVQFGPEDKDNFIENIASGKKLYMARKGGSYVIKADFVAQGVGFPRPVKM